MLQELTADTFQSMDKNMESNRVYMASTRPGLEAAAVLTLEVKSGLRVRRNIMLILLAQCLITVDTAQDLSRSLDHGS